MNAEMSICSSVSWISASWESSETLLCLFYTKTERTQTTQQPPEDRAMKINNTFMLPRAWRPSPDTRLDLWLQNWHGVSWNVSLFALTKGIHEWLEISPHFLVPLVGQTMRFNPPSGEALWQAKSPFVFFSFCLAHLVNEFDLTGSGVSRFKSHSNSFDYLRFLFGSLL